MPEIVTIAQTLRLATEKLRAAAVPNDVLDAQTLLAEALGCDRTYLIIHFNQELTTETLEKYERLIARRAAGEPLQYIVGHQEFFGLEFEVTPDVLIPRPETELIVEETIRLVQAGQSSRSDWQPLMIDVGTGSGCIAVTLAREIRNARLIAADLSLAALRVARRNAARHGLLERVDFIAGDLLEAFVQRPSADFIISNPPYVVARDLETLQREVRDWEPRSALTDFGDGLNFYRRLLSAAPARLHPGGFLICEMGYAQAEAVTKLIDTNRWEEARLLPDLQGIPRTLVLRQVS
jgi:release factor glutamine methyltransferase